MLSVFVEPASRGWRARDEPPAAQWATITPLAHPLGNPSAIVPTDYPLEREFHIRSKLSSIRLAMVAIPAIDRGAWLRAALAK